MKNYIEVNKKSWNERTQWHLKSEFYDVESFINGKTSLKEIEIDLLGNIQGKKILHLQCHFGQDTLSLARMGAQVTGIDLSNEAIKEAKILAEKINMDANFICCDIYEADKYLNETYDIVFTSYGVIGWLPDLNRWAELISRFLKPNGKFVMVEFHPVVWMFDDHFEKISYNYFNTGPIIETGTGTYADKNAEIKPETVNWNHSLSEVINSLISKDLEIKVLNEYDFSPYNCFEKTKKIAESRYIIEPFSNQIPITYAILAEKK